MAVSVEQLCDVARVAIESDVNYCNQVLAKKRAWMHLHMLSLIPFCLYGLIHQHYPRWMLELIYMEVNLMFVEFGFTLLVWLLTYLFPFKARDWGGWFPVLIVRWNNLEKPGPDQIRAAVARIIEWFGADMNRQLATMEEKMRVIR